MTPVLNALAEPNRLRIVELLQRGEQPVGQLARELRLPQPSMSKHLKALEQAGLVRVRRDAQRRWYRLRLDPLLELDRWLEPYRRLWAARLDALEEHLESMED